ncbi:MAG: ABC transporter permease [Chloroflexota bacterium]|nr:ABC transporter permease [Chloroflexota bacterium]
MYRFLVERLSLGLLTVAGLTILVFFVMRVLPGDPLVVMFGREESFDLRPQDREKLIQSLGLDRPLVAQYVSWVGGLLHGRMGKSFWRERDIGHLVARRGPVTAEIAVGAILVAWLIGLPAGAFSAIKFNTPGDYLVRIGAVVSFAVPNFWLALLVLLLLVTTNVWVPPLIYVPIWSNPWQNLQMILLPSLVLGAGLAGYYSRMVRSQVLEVLRQDYVRTARAKGLPSWQVLTRHIMRTALIPVITLSSVSIASLLGGSVIIETIFNIPGLGRTLYQGFLEKDFLVVQNMVLLSGIAFIVANLVIDILYGWLDPRIRVS